jgi:hypothetical protein
MKHQIITILAAAILLAAATNIPADYTPGPATAEVERYRGFYIFVDSKPVLEYEYLGTEKATGLGFGDTQYTGVRDRLIKKAQKTYPEADALILNFKSGGWDTFDAIKFIDTED